MTDAGAAADDRGAGAVTAIGILALCLLLATALASATAIAPARHRAAAAADAAALAAADTRSGIHAGDPCEQAARLAAAHGAELSACVTDGAVVTVETAVRTAFVTVVAAATAGPPP
ncbi:MAG TPA: Rv3654c family TadE-like protein [Microbacteriaceae bacterium]|nr:Rv3654c family TadE-like protein [Microbacteriaceae bacterium]